ncbi:hypothetical protein GCM10018952_75240 [Streptosporangium vulgare]
MDWQGVAHGRHRVTSAEQGAQQDELGVAGVLVLVQEDHGEPPALDLADVGVLGRDPGGERHLVAVVDDLPAPLEPVVRLDQRQQLLPGPLDDERPALVLDRRAGQLGVPLGEPGADVAHVPRGAQVLGHLPGQLQHRPGDGRRTPLDLLHRPVVRADHPPRELPGDGRGDQAHGRLQRLAQGVVGDQAGRVGVVRRDGRLALHQVGGHLLGLDQAVEPLAHAGGQLPGRLPGEGQAEHLLGTDQAVGDQPDDTPGHGLALARTGSGHHHHRFETGLDHGGLLGGRRQDAQLGGELDRAQHVASPGVVRLSTPDLRSC